MKITQSFIKDVRKYLAPGSDFCGNVLKAIWVDGKQTIPSDAMSEGTLFEFYVSGAIPKDGKTPEPVMTQRGSMSVGSIRAKSNAARVTAYLEEMRLKIVAFNKRLTKGRFEGTVDLICEATKTIRFEDGFVLTKGTQIVIDLKYAGMIEDRYSVHGWGVPTLDGWAWTPDQKTYKATQAIQYNYISDLPFYLLVLSSKNEKDVKLFRTIINSEAIEKHIQEGNYLMEQFEFLKDVDGFTARPEVSKCADCFLKEGCKDKHTFPHAIAIDLTV